MVHDKGSPTKGSQTKGSQWKVDRHGVEISDLAGLMKKFFFSSGDENDASLLEMEAGLKTITLTTYMYMEININTKSSLYACVDQNYVPLIDLEARLSSF